MISNYELQYMNLVRNIMDVGYYDNNRTGMATKKLPHQSITVDLQREFPILKTKQVFFKTAVKEILWIMQKQSNNINDLGGHIWDEWADESGSIGKAYGYQVSPTNKSFEVIKIKSTPKKTKSKTPLQTRFFDLIDIENNDEKVGLIFKNISGLDFKIIKYKSMNKHYEKKYDIQFLNSGYIVKDVLWGNITRGEIKDKFARTFCNVGYIGNKNYKNIDSALEKKLFNTWNSMILRCYDTNNNSYNEYGGSGIFVHDDWLCFSNFVEGVRMIPNWKNKINNWSEYQLDKDYYGANYYSVNTCAWLTNSDNALYRHKNFKPFKIIKPNNEEYVYISQSRCSEDYNIDRSGIGKCLNGKFKQFKGYNFKYVKENNDYVYRYKLPINQINELINTLKSDPQSRRMIISLWNVNDLEEMNLQPCCHTSMWDVNDGELNCMLVQRSGDVGLGVPFNTTQYAVLTHLIAQATGLKVGMLTHIINNAHIYENHFEAMKKQLNRYDRLKYIEELKEPYMEEVKNNNLLLKSNPQLKLNPNIKDFYEFTIDDIILEDYEHMGKLEMEVSV